MTLSEAEVVYNLALGYIGEYKVTEGDETTKQAILCIRFYADARDEVLASHPWNEAMVRTIVIQNATNPLFGYDRRYGVPSAALRVTSVDDVIGSDVSRKSAGIDAWEVEGAFILADAGATPPSWTTATAYIVGHVVTNNSVTYTCLVAHTSGALDDEPGVGAVTDTYWTDSGGDYRIVYVTYITQLTTTSSWSPKLKQAIALNLASKIIVGLTNNTKGKVALLEELEKLVMPAARSVDGAEGKPKPIFSSEWLRSRRTGTGGVYVT